MTPFPRRPGVTMLEVLVAIFVMAVGLMALLALFPLGAMRTAQNLKDARCTEAAQQADGVVRDYWASHVTTADPAKRDEWLLDAFRDPAHSTPPAADPHQWPFVADTNHLGYTDVPAGYTGASYPVVIDPLGHLARAADDPARWWVGHHSRNQTGFAYSLVRRATFGKLMSGATDPAVKMQGDSALARRTFTLSDDAGFAENGEVRRDANGVIEAGGGRYSWAAAVQLTNADDPTTASLKILVFDGRPPLLAQDLPGNEDEVHLRDGVTWKTGRRDIDIRVIARSTDQLPVIRRGGWVFDVTQDLLTTPPTRHFIPYRVVGVTDYKDPMSGADRVVLDLDRPVERPDGLKGDYLGAALFLPGLAEVFDRPPLTRPQ